MADRRKLEDGEEVHHYPQSSDVSKSDLMMSAGGQVRHLTLVLLRLLHTGSQETHQLPLFNHRQLTARKHVSSAAGHLTDR